MALARASLLTPEQDGMEKRYRLLEPLRNCRFAFVGAPQRKRRGASMPTTTSSSQSRLAPRLAPPASPWVDRLALSYAELRQALAWSPASVTRCEFCGLPALREFWYRRGWAGEAARWTARMLEGDLGAVPPTLLAEVHSAAGFASILR